MNNNVSDKRYAIELFHWSGMEDINLVDLTEVLEDDPSLINETNGVGDNALIIAARAGNLNIVRYFVESTDININHKCPEGNALLVAIKKNRGNIASYLIENSSIDLNSTCSQQKSAYHYAAKNGMDETIEALLGKNIDINVKDHKGNHCLYDLVGNYKISSYYSFELILEHMNHDVLFGKNDNGHDIFQFMKYLVDNAPNKLAKQERANDFEVLIKILNHKLENKN